MIRRLVLATAMVGVLFVSPAALAQKDDGGAPAPPAEATSSGDPLYGYLAFGALAGLFLFNLCRSSRRS